MFEIRKLFVFLKKQDEKEEKGNTPRRERCPFPVCPSIRHQVLDFYTKLADVEAASKWVKFHHYSKQITTKTSSFQVRFVF